MYYRNKHTLYGVRYYPWFKALGLLEHILMDKGGFIYILSEFSLALTTHIAHHLCYMCSFLKG